MTFIIYQSKSDNLRVLSKYTELALVRFELTTLGL